MAEDQDRENLEEPGAETPADADGAGADAADSAWDGEEAKAALVDDGDPFPDDIFGSPPAPTIAERLAAEEADAAQAATVAAGQGGGTSHPAAGGAPQGAGGIVVTRRGRQVEPVSYDFRRPIQLSKGFSRSLTIVSETFAKLLTLSLSNYLRIPVSVTAKGVRQVLFEEHTSGMSNPSCINILDLSPIKIPGMLDIDIHLVFAMIEKLLGSADIHDDVKREFTSIESRIARKIVLRMLTDLREALLRVLEVDVGLNAIEHNPDFTYIMNANDACILLHFEMELGEFSGNMSVCISLTGLDAEVGTEGASPYRDVRSQSERREDEQRLSLVLDSTSADIVAEVGRLRLNYEDLKGLREGSVISLRKHSSEAVKVMVGGCPLFLASMGRFQSKSAVRVTEVLRPRPQPLGGAGDHS